MWLLPAVAGAGGASPAVVAVVPGFVRVYSSCISIPAQSYPKARGRSISGMRIRISRRCYLDR